MPIGAGFRLSKIVVVESLEPHERRTGEEIAAFIESTSDFERLALSVNYISCESAPAFSNLLVELAAEVRSTGAIPLLHVECHGDRAAGLEFRNGSVMSWNELSSRLLDLNLATRFNLVATFSACYGAHFLSQINVIGPSPCFAMIAPTEAARVYELARGFQAFYSALLSSSDAGIAVDALSKLTLTEGEWFSHLAEFWYERVVVGYVETHCTVHETKQRALRMLHKLQSEGVTADIGALRRQLVQANRRDLVGKFFDTYFMTELLPENHYRFAPVRERVGQKIESLRKTGRYGV